MNLKEELKKLRPNLSDGSIKTYSSILRNLHKKIFTIIYNSNGGFNWHDLYFMPVKLREFYWNELLNQKNHENESYEAIVNKSSNGSRNSLARRK